MHPLVTEAAVIVAIMLVTSATQIAGLSLCAPVAQRFKPQGGLPHHGLVLVGLALGILALHVLEIVEYAVLYRMLGAFDFETALYFSAASYSTIGTADLHLPQPWRLVGAFEGLNGFVLVGWSTGFMFGAWRDIFQAKA